MSFSAIHNMHIIEVMQIDRYTKGNKAMPTPSVHIFITNVDTACNVNPRSGIAASAPGECQVNLG